MVSGPAQKDRDSAGCYSNCLLIYPCRLELADKPTKNLTDSKEKESHMVYGWSWLEDWGITDDGWNQEHRTLWGFPQWCCMVAAGSHNPQSHSVLSYSLSYSYLSFFLVFTVLLSAVLVVSSHCHVPIHCPPPFFSSLSTFLLSHIEFTSFLISLPLFFNFSIFSMSFFSLLSIYCPRSTVQSASVESIDTAQRGPILVRQMYYKSSVISLLSYYLPTASLSSHCTTASSSLFSMLYGIRSARSSSRRYMAIIMVHLMWGDLLVHDALVVCWSTRSSRSRRSSLHAGLLFSPVSPSYS